MSDDGHNFSSGPSSPERHIKLFNEAYADPKTRQVIDALTAAMNKSSSEHLLKRDIAAECDDLDVKEISGHEILETLQALAIVRLVTKVVGAANNEEYVLPNSRVLQAVCKTMGWGLRAADLEEYPEAEELLKRFAEHYESLSGEPNNGEGSDPSPHELYLEHQIIRKEGGSSFLSSEDLDVSVDFTVDSRKVNSNTRKYTFEISGEIRGLTTAQNTEIVDFLKQEMMQLARAATHGTEPWCSCQSLEEHLQSIEPSGDGCRPAEDVHHAKFIEEDRAVFKTKLHNLQRN